MDVEFHLPFSSAVPIETIPSKPSRLLMLFLTCRANEDGHAIALPAYLAIAVMTRRRIHPRLAKRNTEHGSGLGRHRWVVERTFAWLNQFRHLRVRYDKRSDIHEAFLSLGCALICWHFLESAWMSH